MPRLSHAVQIPAKIQQAALQNWISVTIETDAQYACTNNTRAIFQPDPAPHLIIHNTSSTCEAIALLLRCRSPRDRSCSARSGACSRERGCEGQQPRSHLGAVPAELLQCAGRAQGCPHRGLGSAALPLLSQPQSQQAPATQVAHLTSIMFLRNATPFKGDPAGFLQHCSSTNSASDYFLSNRQTGLQPGLC